MSFPIVIDMNLTPRWVEVLGSAGWTARHWSHVGEATASDRDIMDWAQRNGYAVFTHDLDFGTILAVTQAQGPSVIQVRTQDVMPEHIADVVITALRQYKTLLEEGALIVVDEATARARILPLHT
jgi:predicted nuclease of predicted toxin-antitoxin system